MKALPVSLASFMNRAMSLAMGAGTGMASVDLTRSAVIRYEASWEVDQTLGFEGKSSNFTGEERGGREGRVSALFVRVVKGRMSSELEKPSLVGDSIEGGIGNGRGDSAKMEDRLGDASELVYRCFEFGLGEVGI